VEWQGKWLQYFGFMHSAVAFFGGAFASFFWSCS
jgi:hypothetical protein